MLTQQTMWSKRPFCPERGSRIVIGSPRLPVNGQQTIQSASSGLLVGSPADNSKVPVKHALYYVISVNMMVMDFLSFQAGASPIIKQIRTLA